MRDGQVRHYAEEMYVHSNPEAAARLRTFLADEPARFEALARKFNIVGVALRELKKAKGRGR